MAGAASVLEVLIVGDATSLQAALGQANAATQTFAASTTSASKQTAAAGKTASSFGKLASIGYTVAAAGAVLFAKASIESATEYNRQFAQIDALTNATTGNIELMKSSVMSLAQETASSPVELAHAMYFLASAGLTTTQQFAALDAVAHGMAIGLGEGADLARITANALNVFSDNGLTATGVMDTLAAAIREGTAEPDEFADALGRVLPIADQAGISFAEVAGSLSTLSNAGLDVREGVTALRAILQSLVAPSAQTEDALRTIGLTVDDVVSSMKNSGVIATLRMLEDRTRANTDSAGEFNQTMRHLIPNIRGLAGALNLTHQSAVKVDEIYRAVAQSQGALADSFKTTAESDAFKMKQALNDIAIMGQNLATTVLPVLADALGVIARNFDQIALAAGVFVAGRIIEKVVALGAASGVSAVETAALATAEGSAATAAVGLEGAAAGAATAIELEGAAALTTGGEIVALQAANRALAIETTMASGAMKLLNSGLARNAAGLYALGVSFLAAKDEVHAFMDQDPAAYFNAINTGINRLPGVFMPGGFKMPMLPDHAAMENFNAEIDLLKQQMEEIGLTTEQMDSVTRAAVADIGGELNAENVGEYTNKVRELIAGWQQVAQASGPVVDAVGGIADQIGYAVQGLGKGVSAAKAYSMSVEEITAPLGQLENAGVDVNGFLEEFQTNLEDGDDSLVAFDAGIQKIKDSMSDWRADAATQLTDISGLLGTLADRGGISLEQITGKFEAQAKAARDFADDLKVIGQTGGQGGKDLAAGLLAGGLGWAGLADKIASGAPKAREAAVHAFAGIGIAGAEGAIQLQKVLVPVLNSIRNILYKLATEKWGIILPPLNDGGNKKKIDDLYHGLKNLTVKEWNAQVHTTVTGINDVDRAQEKLTNITGQYKALVTVHTTTESPWPDEALKMHLFDPLKRMGAKKIGGVWTIPLTVGVHSNTTSLAIQKAMSAAPKGFAMAREAVGSDRYAKLMKAIKEDAHKTGELHLKALRKIIADESSGKRARAWAEAAVEAFDKRMAQAEEPPAWIQTALRDVPRLPRGNTHIDPNSHKGEPGYRRHRRGVEIRLDRKHYADQMTQEVSYGRGY